MTEFRAQSHLGFWFAPDNVKLISMSKLFYKRLAEGAISVVKCTYRKRSPILERREMVKYFTSCMRMGYFFSTGLQRSFSCIFFEAKLLWGWHTNNLGLKGVVDFFFSWMLNLVSCCLSLSFFYQTQFRFVLFASANRFIPSQVAASSVTMEVGALISNF